MDRGHLLHRFSDSTNGQPTITDPNDPHAKRLVPAWAVLRVHAEPGTLCRFRDVQDGAIDVFVRGPMSLSWPASTPPLVSGEQQYQIVPPATAFFIQTRQAMFVDHEFTPSLLEPSTCRICALPSRMRWLLECFRQSDEAGATERVVAWFDDHDEALAERTRLAAESDVLAVGLHQALYREEAESFLGEP